MSHWLSMKLPLDPGDEVIQLEPNLDQPGMIASTRFGRMFLVQEMMSDKFVYSEWKVPFPPQDTE